MLIAAPTAVHSRLKEPAAASTRLASHEIYRYVTEQQEKFSHDHEGKDGSEASKSNPK